MARVVITSAGYLGDFAPYIPVATRLAGRGHDVTFLAPEGFHGILRDEPVKVATYPLDFSSGGMHADPQHEKLMRHPYRNVSMLARYWMSKGFGDNPTAARESLLDVLAGADVVVSHPTFAIVTAPVAQHLNVPLVVGHLFPMMIPTSHWTPPLGARSANLGRLLNRAVWTAMDAGSRRPFHQRQVNEMRRKLSLANEWSSANSAWRSAARIVVMASRHYAGEGAPDWPDVTWGGFSVWPGPAGLSLDPELDAFVDDGDPPVLVTLGTSAATGAGETFATIAGDLDRLGLRSIMLVGDAKNLPALRGRQGAVAFAPVTPLLPRCRVAVVSGALGALAAALTAGVPVVVAPQLIDQLWHGRRVEQLGVGIRAKRPGDVAAAVDRIVRDPAYAGRARALAAQMAGEDGATATADAVEEVLSR